MTPVFAASAGAIDACGARPGFVCEWVFDRTGSERWAKLADGLVARPLRILLVLLVAWLLNRLVRRAIGKLINRLISQSRAGSSRQREQWSQRTLTLGSVLNSVAAVTIYGLAALICLDELSVNLGPFIAGAGIAGVALGFGAQSLIRDFLAGAFVIIESQYLVGDVINVGEVTGTVERVTLRTTAVRDFEGVLWTIPNGEIRRVANRSQRTSRAHLDLRVAYEANVETARELIAQMLAELWADPPPGVVLVEQPVVLGIEDFTSGAAVLRIEVVARPDSQAVVAREIRARAKAVFDAAGIKGLAQR